MGVGGSPRQCAINLKRGLPTAPISGGAEGGLSAIYLSVGFLLSDSSYLQKSARHLRAKRAGDLSFGHPFIFSICPKCLLLGYRFCTYP